MNTRFNDDDHRILDAAVPLLKRSMASLQKKPLLGGFRGRTYSVRMLADHVYKFGDLKELIKQQNYVATLPPDLRALFPKIHDVVQISQDEGLIIMDRIEGRTLHELLWQPDLDSVAKVTALFETHLRLDKLHVAECQEPRRQRSLCEFAVQFKKRIPAKAYRDLATCPEFVRLVEEVGEVTDSFVPKTIHGDAQGGNIIINNSFEVYFIDPLGGSAHSPGDPIYDFARLYHWIDFGGECQNWEQYGAGDCFEDAIHNYQQVADQLRRLSLNRTEEYCRKNADRSGVFWFYVYLIFHASGKLNNWTTLRSQQQILSCVKKYARLAINLLDEEN